MPPASRQSVNPPAEPQPSTSAAAESGGESSAPKNLEPPPPPKDVAEALQQRLEKYQHATNQAKQEGNSSKARRMGRIVKVSCSLGSTCYLKTKLQFIFFCCLFCKLHWPLLKVLNQNVIVKNI